MSGVSPCYYDDARVTSRTHYLEMEGEGVCKEGCGYNARGNYSSLLTETSTKQPSIHGPCKGRWKRPAQPPKLHWQEAHSGSSSQFYFSPPYLLPPHTQATHTPPRMLRLCCDPRLARPTLALVWRSRPRPLLVRSVQTNAQYDYPPPDPTETEGDPYQSFPAAGLATPRQVLAWVMNQCGRLD